jgi:hypothetical protein
VAIVGINKFEFFGNYVLKYKEFTTTYIIILPVAKSETHDFDANLFVLMVALWLIWFRHIVQVRLELIG